MQFRYRARRRTGAIDQGLVEATDLQEARRRLRERNLIVSDLRPAAGGLVGWPWFGSVGLRDRMVFTQELALMIRSGLPLARAVSDLESQTTQRTLQKTLRQIATDLRGGMSFADTLAKHPRVFPAMMISVIRSGESSGKLVEVLERLTEQMQKDADLRGKIKSALIYPVILGIGIIAVLLIVILFVIPQLKSIFSDVGVQLPLITRLLLSLTDFLLHFGWLVGVGLLLLIGGFLLIIRHPWGRLVFDQWKLRFPVFGPLSQRVALTRFAATVAMLLGAGIPLLEVLAISKGVVSNRYYEQEIDRIARAAEAGTALSQTMRHGRVFPGLMANLVAVGEESGNLDQTFQAVATFYDRDVEATTRNLTALLEPLLMLLLGGGIGLVVASVLVPIYRLVQAI